MVSTTTYGDFPGVRVNTAGGAITGVAVGREQQLVLIGVGDPGSGNASVNEATQINSRSQADNEFGTDTELATAMKDALNNGANIDFLYGIMLDVTTLGSTETFTTTDSGTLANAPIIEDTSTISAEDGSSNSMTIEFRYESPPTGSPSADTIYLNPITGEWIADTQDDYDFTTYDYPDWTSAFNEAETVIDVEETGLITPLTESSSNASDLSGRLNDLREEYKMATGLQAAEPNSNTSDNDPAYDTGAYSDSIDNDAMYLHAPARIEDSVELLTGALGGLMAGNDIDESIYYDELDVSDLENRIDETDVSNLRSANVIPVKQPQSGGTVTVRDNVSTSDETDWERDYWRRRIVDQAILIAKAVGDTVIGRINDEETRSTAETQIEVELRGLADDRLIQPNTGDETNWFVTVYQIDADTVGIDLGITPYGIAKRIDTTITVDA